MLRVRTYTSNSPVASADLNAIQDNAAGIAQLHGHWLSRPFLRCHDGTDLSVGPTEGLFLSTATVLPAASTYTFTGSAITSLTPDTWYYVYAYNNSGVIAYEISSNAPVTGSGWLVTKTGDTAKIYVGAVRAYDDGGTTKLLAVDMQNRIYTYRHGATTAQLGYSLVLTDQNATTIQTVNCSKLIPPHSKIAKVRIYTRALGAGNVDFGIYAESGFTTPELNLTHDKDVSSLFREFELTISSGSSTNIFYKVTGGTNTDADMSIQIGGFVE
jgi:hypothetical protein